MTGKLRRISTSSHIIVEVSAYTSFLPLMYTGAEFDDRVHKKDPSKPKVTRRVFDPKINDAVDKLAEPFLLDSSGNKVLNQVAFDELWPTLRVLARCQPEDKVCMNNLPSH